MSVNHNASGTSAAKSRRTWSTTSGRRAGGADRGRDLILPRHARMPFVRISRATRCRPARWPAGEQFLVDPRGAVVAELGRGSCGSRRAGFSPAACSPGRGRADSSAARRSSRTATPPRPDTSDRPWFPFVRLLRLDVAVDLYWSARRAKKASAFPKISSSSSLRASSRSKRAIFARSDSAGGPEGGPVTRGEESRFSAARAQFAIVVADRLNSFAKSMNVRPSRRCSSTIWSLNSSE